MDRCIPWPNPKKINRTVFSSRTHTFRRKQFRRLILGLLSLDFCLQVSLDFSYQLFSFQATFFFLFPKCCAEVIVDITKSKNISWNEYSVCNFRSYSSKRAFLFFIIIIHFFSLSALNSESELFIICRLRLNGTYVGVFKLIQVQS